MREYMQDAPLVFWCENCDCKSVQMHNPATGKFFKMWGASGKNLEEYSPIIFALCSDCCIDAANAHRRCFPKEYK